MVSPNARFYVTQSADKNTVNLTIKRVQLSDEGYYTCQLSTEPPTNVVNKLIVTVPPLIKRIGPEVITSTIDVTVSLRCTGEGKPTPTIIWTRMNSGSVDGEIIGNRSTLTLVKTTPGDAGTYICTASNGVLSPSSKNITLELYYAPVMNETEISVMSARGLPVVLKCEYYAHPPANVTWYKNGKRFENRGKISHRRFSYYESQLALEHLKIGDFTEYVCVAVNDKGMSAMTFNLSGLARQPTIIAHQDRIYSTEYTVQWQVSSLEKIEVFGIFVQKTNDSDLTDDWIKTLIPPQPHNTAQSRTYAYIFSNLHRGTQYACKIRAKTYFGWSEFSEIFYFQTNSREETSRLSRLSNKRIRLADNIPYSSSASRSKLYMDDLLLTVFFTLVSYAA